MQNMRPMNWGEFSAALHENKGMAAYNTARSVSQITADLCSVIAFQGDRGVEQGREQVLLDVPDHAARFLHAVENVFDVVAGQGTEPFLHQLSGDLAARESEGIAAGSQHLQDQGNDAVKGLLAVLLPKLVIADIEPHLRSEPLQILRQMRAFQERVRD